MSRHHKRGSGERSNLYSESKSTNWAAFDPFSAEIEALPRWTEPALTVEVGPETRIAVIARDLHPRFTGPVTPREVEGALLKVPPEFLRGLAVVYLLGGTAKQDKVAFGRLFRFGCYGNSRIYLCAFPKRLLTIRYKRLPPPDAMQEFERIGASYTHDRSGWVFRFSPDTLRAFYLHDVLLHEVGHHVDRSNLFQKNEQARERYAKWFTAFCSQQMRRITNQRASAGQAAPYDGRVETGSGSAEVRLQSR